MRNVSITFQNNGETRPVVAAIARDNPTARILELPSVVKIDSPGRLVVRRDSVSAGVGREYDLQELHLNILSLSGNVSEDDDTFTLAWKE